MRSDPVMVAADVTNPGSNGGSFRKLTVVDQASGRTTELDVDQNVNGELDGYVGRVAVLTLSYYRGFRKDAPKGTPPFTAVRVVAAQLAEPPAYDAAA